MSLVVLFAATLVSSWPWVIPIFSVTTTKSREQMVRYRKNQRKVYSPSWSMINVLITPRAEKEKVSARQMPSITTLFLGLRNRWVTWNTRSRGDLFKTTSNWVHNI